MCGEKESPAGEESPAGDGSCRQTKEEQRVAKQVLQRKTEEAAMATKKLKELLETQKSSARDNSVRNEYEKQSQVSSNGSLKHSADDTSAPLSPIAVPAQKQLKYTAGIVNSPSKGAATFDNQPLKVGFLHFC
ncbi:hypothetical protein BHE74_00010979 [Ensete ventricosum]|nr:hypothetical protein BHE74_00010979 [Ensete ventricosum]